MLLCFLRVYFELVVDATIAVDHVLVVLQLFIREMIYVVVAVQMAGFAQ